MLETCERRRAATGKSRSSGQHLKCLECVAPESLETQMHGSSSRTKFFEKEGSKRKARNLWMAARAHWEGKTKIISGARNLKEDNLKKAGKLKKECSWARTTLGMRRGSVALLLQVVLL